MLLNVLEIKMCVGLKKSFKSLRNLSTQHSRYQGPGERMLTIKTCRIQIARSFLHQLVLIWNKKSLAICKYQTATKTTNCDAKVSSFWKHYVNSQSCFRMLYILALPFHANNNYDFWQNTCLTDCCTPTKHCLFVNKRAEHYQCNCMVYSYNQPGSSRSILSSLLWYTHIR